MQTSGLTTTVGKLAKAISAILHPLLMPAYVICMMCSGGLLLSHATVQAKMYFLAVILLNTVIVPGFCMFLFRKINLLKADDNSTVRLLNQRLLPMTILIICYSACMFMIRNAPFAYPVLKMLQAGIGCLVAAAALSPFYNISRHMLAQGATVTFIALMTAAGSTTVMFILLCLAVAAAAALASARLTLGRNNPKQIIASFALGLIVTLLTTYLL